MVETPTAADLAREAKARAGADVVLMAAAVADYAPEPVAGKRPKSGEPWSLELLPTEDVLAGLGASKNGTLLVGFGAEEGEQGLERKRRMLAEKNLDLVVFNDVSKPGIGFDSPENEVDARLGRRGADGREGAEGADRRRDPRRGREAARCESRDCVSRLKRASLNPPDSSSAAMRASSGGWVSNAPLKSEPRPEVWFSGLSMNMCATARGAWRVCCVSTWSLRSASARPSPSPVISAADASARYSRRRETASWIRTPATGARSSAARPRINATIPSPPLCRRPPPQNATRSRMSETSAISADEHGDERHQPDVAVPHVRHLVGEHALELALVHQLQQAGGDGDVGVLRVAAGRERVRRRVVDHVDRRHRLDPGGDADRLEDVVEARVLRAVGGLRAGEAGDHPARPRTS